MIECSVDVENVGIEIVAYSLIMANVGNTPLCIIPIGYGCRCTKVALVYLDVSRCD